MLPFYLLCRKDIYVWNDYEIILHDLDKYKVENLTLKRDTSYSEMIVLFQIRNLFSVCTQGRFVLRGRFKEPAVECSTIFNWTEFNNLLDIIDIYFFLFACRFK